MFLLSSNADVDRAIIIIICKYIYNNRFKLNFLSTCKFVYSVIDSIYFYQQVKIYKNVSSMINIKRFANVHVDSYSVKTYFSNDKFFNDANKIKISNYKLYSVTDQKIFYLPPALKKLKINSDCELNQNITYPKYLEILYLPELKQQMQSFPLGLKKLCINNLTFGKTNILHLNLTYLKIVGYVNFDTILSNLPLGLKTLIFKSNDNDHKYQSDTIFSSLPLSITYLGLGSSFDKLNRDNFRKIIPKNITRLKTNISECFNSLHGYTYLKKIIIDDTHLILLPEIKNLPQCVKSISYNYDKRWQSPNKVFVDFLHTIPKSITTLLINKYENFMTIHIPKNITKLKVYNMYTWQSYYDKNCTISCSLLKTIQELHIKNIIKVDDKLLIINPSPEKLIIGSDQKYFLHNSIYDTREVILK